MIYAGLNTVFHYSEFSAHIMKRNIFMNDYVYYKQIFG